MFRDVEYANNFADTIIPDFYVPEPLYMTEQQFYVPEQHHNKTDWIIQPCPQSCFDAATESPPTIPTPSVIADDVSRPTADDMTFESALEDIPLPVHPGNHMFDSHSTCEDTVQKHQSVQPLESHQSQGQQEDQQQVSVQPQHPPPQVPRQPQQQPIFLQPLNPPQSQSPATLQQYGVQDSNVYNLQLCSLQQQQPLFPTPPQSEAGMIYQKPTRDAPQDEQNSQVTTVTSMGTLLEVVKKLILCSTCNKPFNRAVICHDYMIQLNRPIQCACSCVICTLCYRQQGGCHVHNVSSTRGAINTTASILASSPDLETLGQWDLDLKLDDHFKTDDDVNIHVQRILNDEDVPSVEKLRTGRCILCM